jgi:hypothetical protein
VGRFEWRRFPELGLADDGGLYRVVHETPAPRRHFFVHVGPQGTSCSLIDRRTLGTMSEAVALSKWIEMEKTRRLIIISSGFHLRRATEAVRHYCSQSAPLIIPVAVPNVFETDRKLTLVTIELAKSMLYRVLLKLRGIWSHIRTARR